MKIEPKKCPTCGGNLKFEYGEENASCPYCKREYIIEYESPNYTDLIHLKEYYAKLAENANYFERVIDVLSNKEILKNKL